MPCFTARASEPLPPRGRDLELEGTALRCYTLAEYKQVAKDYVDHGAALASLERAQREVQLVEVGRVAWQAALTAAESQLQGLKISLANEQQLRREDNEASRKQRLISAGGLIISIVALGTIGVIETVK
jgi:hypothetical protein